MDIDTLWYSYCPGPNAVGIASQLGWLADEYSRDGITVRTLASASSAGAPQVIRDAHQLVPQPGAFRHLFRHGGNPPALVALSRDFDFRIVGLSWTEATRRVLVFEDSPIRTASNLEGARLSLPTWKGAAVDYLRSVTLRTYALALASAGLTFDDVELVEVTYERALAALRPEKSKALPYNATLWGARTNAGAQRAEALALVRGEIDALASEHAQAAHLQATFGLRAVFDTATAPSAEDRASGDQPLVLTVDRSLLEARPDIVARWIARANDAAEWARTHRSEARRLIARDAGLPEELIDTAYSSDVHEQLSIDLDDRSVRALQVQHDHLLAHGFLANDGFDVESFIDPAPLEAARELSTQEPLATAA